MLFGRIAEEHLVLAAVSLAVSLLVGWMGVRFLYRKPRDQTDVVPCSWTWPSRPLVQRQVAVLDVLDIDYTELAPATIFASIWRVLEDRGLLGILTIDQTALRQFLLQIGSEYLDNPYHNIRHAFQVFHISNVLLWSPHAGHLDPLDRLAILLGAFCHDVGHKGTTNEFEVSTSSRLALVYNDKSVMENYHASRTFQIMAKHDFLAVLPVQDRQRFRSSVIEAILHTDMKNHSAMVNHVKSAIAGADAGKASNLCLEDQKQTLMNLIVHASDIGHCVIPWTVHEKLSRLVRREFVAQAAAEASAGVPVSAFMLNQEDESSFVRGQVGFLKYVAEPLWSLVDEILGIPQAIRNLESNTQAWESKASS